MWWFGSFVVVLLWPMFLLDKALEKRYPSDGDRGESVPVIDTKTPLVGSRGKAFTALRPVGRIVVSGRKYSARSNGAFVDAGCPVVILRLEMGELVVEVFDEKSTQMTDG